MSHRTIFYEVFFFSATIIATLSVHAQIACTNPSPQPTGYALPCPVFSLSQNSVPQSGTLTLSAAPQASTDYIHTTVFISQNSAWQPYTLQGNGPYPGYSNILSTLNLSSTQLATLSVGIHYAIVWDWLWDSTLQCYKGPGLNQCNAGQWRIQTFSVTTGSYTYSQSAYVSGKCGPPTYPCSRSDFNVQQLPNPLPSMGGTMGVNKIVTPSDFNNPIVRVTDRNTNPADLDRSYHVTTTGANTDVMWNSDSTMLTVTREGTGSYRVIGFNPTIMQATQVIPGFQVGGVLTWSRTNPKVLYTFAGMVITKWTFADTVTPPASSALYNFANCAAAPVAANVTWTGEIAANADDTIFGTAVSTTGNQNTGYWSLGYNKTLNACSVYNTSTGQIAGTWGPTGAATDPAHFTIHQSEFFKGGWLDLTGGGCISGDCVGQALDHYFWKPGTLTVTFSDLALSGGGHSAGGYNTWLNINGFPIILLRPFSNPASFSQWAGALPPFSSEVGGAHIGWMNGGPNDINDVNSAFFGTTEAPKVTIFTAAFTGVVFGYTPNGKLRRFAHTFGTGANSSFYDAFTIGGVSQDGKWFAWTSDWLNTLGTGVGTADGHRNDVFVVKLQ